MSRSAQRVSLDHLYMTWRLTSGRRKSSDDSKDGGQDEGHSETAFRPHLSSMEAAKDAPTAHDHHDPVDAYESLATFERKPRDADELSEALKRFKVLGSTFYRLGRVCTLVFSSKVATDSDRSSNAFPPTHH